jgi:hypothetical protein
VHHPTSGHDDFYPALRLCTWRQIVKTADDPSDRTIDSSTSAASTMVATAEPRRETSRAFEYHLRQAYHMAECDEVRYHIRKAASSLDE